MTTLSPSPTSTARPSTARTLRWGVPAVRGLLLAAVLVPGAFAVSALPAEAQGRTMRQWQYVPAADGDGCELGLREVALPSPGPGEIQVRIRATSLNGRDRGRLSGNCGSGPVQIPLSDGAGEVTAVGPGVTRFRVGDRVIGTFYSGHHWLSGDRPEGVMPYRRGGPGQGMLAEYVVDGEDGWVSMPRYMTYEEAATLTTAAVTAYVGLFSFGGLRPNEYVLLEGTGGVSSFGLLFAAAVGARPIITSSSDEKLARAVELGAVGTVNYRRVPEWQEEVLRLTGGVGVANVLEIGGEETLGRALEAMAIGGRVALIGGLTGFAGSIPAGPVFDKDITVKGFHVGSRADFEELNGFLEGHEIHPIIDRVFEFDRAPDAFDFYLNGDFMGKIVIRH